MLIWKDFLNWGKKLKQCPEGSKEVRGGFFEDERDDEGLNSSRIFENEKSGADVIERTPKT